MARFTDNDSRSYISVNFADDEDEALAFADRHWPRIFSIVYNTDPKEVKGWTVYYYKNNGADEAVKGAVKKGSGPVLLAAK